MGSCVRVYAWAACVPQKVGRKGGRAFPTHVYGVRPARPDSWLADWWPAHVPNESYLRVRTTRSMLLNGKQHRTIWLDANDQLFIIDQRQLPHDLVVEQLPDLAATARAIREMHVRGAPLIGATAAYGMYRAAQAAAPASWQADLQAAARQLNATRPTAVDLFHATRKSLERALQAGGLEEAVAITRSVATELADESVEQCRRIGQHGLQLIKEVADRKKGAPVHILTHCNAGWMACIDHGTATAPIYAAQAAGIPVHVWVDETRPRLQGSRITAFELGQQGVAHTVIVDNTGGHLMQHGMVDLVIVGTDRTTRRGDVANKIGTYLKALAAKDNGVPFYVALPSTTIDWSIEDGLRDIPIEERAPEEVSHVGAELICPADSPVRNYGFDVTPARLVTGLITERGICAASAAGLAALFPEVVSTAP